MPVPCLRELEMGKTLFIFHNIPFRALHHRSIGCPPYTRLDKPFNEAKLDNDIANHSI